MIGRVSLKSLAAKQESLRVNLPLYVSWKNGDPGWYLQAIESGQFLDMSNILPHPRL